MLYYNGQRQIGIWYVDKDLIAINKNLILIDRIKVLVSKAYGIGNEEMKQILNKPIIITNTAARECIENYQKSLILENSEDEIYDGLYKLLKDNDERILNNTQANAKYDNTEKLQKIIELVGD